MNKETLFSSSSLIVIQHSCENSTANVRRPWGQAPLQQESSVHLCSGHFCSALCWSALPCPGLLYFAPMRYFHLWCFSCSLCWKGKICHQGQRGADFYRQTSPLLVLNWFTLSVQIRTQTPCSLIGPKGTVLIDQNRTALIGH